MHAERTTPTLRELAGLPTDLPSIADAVLIVIDAQQAYSDTGTLTLVGHAAATERIAALLEHARMARATIIHVAHRGAAGSAFDPLAGGCFLGGAEPGPGEAVVHKDLPNAFAGTNLAELIGTDAKRPLILCGFMTHMCVSSTARAALDLGFETTVVSDATATRDLPGGVGDGAVIPAATVHDAELAALADRFSVVATTQQILHRSRPRTGRPNNNNNTRSTP